MSADHSQMISFVIAGSLSPLRHLRRSNLSRTFPITNAWWSNGRGVRIRFWELRREPWHRMVRSDRHLFRARDGVGTESAMPKDIVATLADVPPQSRAIDSGLPYPFHSTAARVAVLACSCAGASFWSHSPGWTPG